MKPIKEQFAPHVQELARSQRERWLYEACSGPWFVMDWKEPEEEVDLSSETAEEMIASGRLVRLTEKDFVLPFPRVVLVTNLSRGNCVIAIFDNHNLTQWIGYSSRGKWQGWAPVRMDGSDKEAMTQFAVLWAKFARHFSDPSKHVAKVRPINAMKSVEWAKSQEHYVFLSTDYRSESESGSPREQSDHESQTLKRMAHWVRAHNRMLRSPRFRFKQGQTVRVKEQWRGPKEWADKRSRQIYQWVDKTALFERKEAREAA